IVVVHLAAQHLPAPRAALGRSDRGRHRGETLQAHALEVDEAGRAQPERPEDAIVAEAIERRTGDQLYQLAQKQEAEVAVEAAGGWRVLEPRAVDLLVDELARAAAREHGRAPIARRLGDLGVERPPRRQPRAVGEQVVHADAGLSVHAEIGDEAGDAVVDAQL